MLSPLSGSHEHKLIVSLAKDPWIFVGIPLTGISTSAAVWTHKHTQSDVLRAYLCVVAMRILCSLKWQSQANPTRTRPANHAKIHHTEWTNYECFDTTKMMKYKQYW